MKNIILISLLILGLWGCQDDGYDFEVSVPRENISFKPMPGGAVMYYKIPENSGIFSVRARYSDVQGKEVVCGASYLSDSVELVGFNEARENIPVYISFCDQADNVSKEMKLTFSTEDSAPFAFFDKLQVSPHWGGFSVIYEAPEYATGIAHVFYLGKDPLTNDPDTLLISSFNISAGKDTMFFTLKQNELAENTVVIRTEDFRGYRVKQKVWEGVGAYFSQKLEPSAFEFIDVNNLSFENDNYKTGVQYLFDGDLKGRQAQIAGIDMKKLYLFLTKPDAVGAPFIIDLKEPKVPASLRFYGALMGAQLWPGTDDDRVMGSIFEGAYENKLPCKVTVYASNDKEDDGSWEKIGYYDESPSAAAENRWVERTAGWDNWLNTLDEFDRAEPCYMAIEFVAQEKTYRYLKFVVNDTFLHRDYPDSYVNKDRRFTLQELEVYVKKD